MIIIYKLSLLLLSITLSYCQLLKTTWNITQSNTTMSSPWKQKGLTKTQGFCLWRIKSLNQNIQLTLYQDTQYKNYMFITIYLSRSISIYFPSYNQTAHIQSTKNNKYHQQDIKQSKKVNVSFQQNNLIIIDQNATLMIQLKPENISQYLYLIAAFHTTAKFILIFLLITNFRRDNTKLSISFVYTLIGWQLQANITVIQLFQASDSPGDHFFGMMIGMFGWGSTLICLFYLPRGNVLWQQIQGLIIYFYTCSNGFLFSQDINIFLYSLSPLLQIRFNSLKNIKNQTPIQSILLYFINIIFVLYIKGCPACFLRYPLNYKLCVLIIIVSIIMVFLLYYQATKGPYLCLREIINGKDYNYYQDIVLSQGEQIIQEVCSICLQPLGEQLLVENIKVDQTGKKIGKIMKTPCGHRYHGSCLRKWLLEKNTCPLDNRKIPPLYQ